MKIRSRHKRRDLSLVAVSTSDFFLLAKTVSNDFCPTALAASFVADGMSEVILY